MATSTKGVCGDRGYVEWPVSKPKSPSNCSEVVKDTMVGSGSNIKDHQVTDLHRQSTGWANARITGEWSRAA